jgi:hypothetical protein
MPKITYYALIDDTHPPERPSGIVRRTHTDPVPTDEAFGRDLQWHPTEFLRRHWLGHNEDDYIEISEQAAQAVISAWRARLS